MNCAVIFGGSGFIGTFFAKHLIESKTVDVVYLYDKEQVGQKPFPYREALITQTSNIKEVNGDVRKPIVWTPQESVYLVANFAAVHREPGHEDFEYYETNLLGAEHVCAWAEQINCSNIIFTSSISPYGPSDQAKDERSTPSPTTAYGGSKLAAEKIHQMWLAADQKTRHLVIARPGVVFGPSEGGNVSRLIKSVLNRYFFYTGNRETRKAGTYVKELCIAMLWVLKKQHANKSNLSLFNMTMNPGPSIEEYVKSVCIVAKIKRRVPSVPFTLLLSASHCIDAIATPLGIQHPFKPTRVKKLVKSNNILPTFLLENGYSYEYTLESALSDWKKNNPDEWT
ncbi:NAD-dependent epimerase/dehydratase family protein [Pseudomonas vancouverensis]|uniref:NAD-dependent epimerase/dehydratase family protein n=1 Tax=Pseudomonas vancouverensis TaxID=95300 RepID=A0A1H2MWF9_PSEVA|nr:NAD(P)-dependent oxidoreductase [Pseudomonas vancouverensis]KAB0489633.1 NAD-dependent epimerase/dehydratase family protein [Pseudomonas vancouverensis]TDB69279.1 NAD-dependent epimerase/dehydratase family protein [Pseudomonas vancouverensis]SDU97579.1 Nucleoside-diphosphate-sugar epimerase [Pseudomonas vancouverensis]